MANTIIQIKRSTNTSIPANLASGELAFTSNGNILYLGSPNGSIIPIGGLRNPGILTANQEIVTDANGYIDQIKLTTLTVNNLNISNLDGGTF